MSSILSKSVNSKKLTMTCPRMISLTLLLLLIVCVSVESTKRYTSVTIVTKHFRTLHEHAISLFPTSSKKSNVLWTYSLRSILLWRRRKYNRFLKYYLCEAAFSLVRCYKEYSDFYHLKYKEVNRYQHKRVFALTARKFVRLVFRLLKDNRLYTSAE